MDKKIRRIAFFAAVYAIIFWVGYKFGESYIRMRMLEDRTSAEIIEIQARKDANKNETFFIVEWSGVEPNRAAFIKEVSIDNTMIKLFYSDKLRKLLKTQDIEIYNGSGDRIY